MSVDVAVVTGASGGIGSEICRLLASQGTKLILLDRNAEKSEAFAVALNARNRSAVCDTFAVDLGDHADIARVTAAILRGHSKIDAVFNNAGVLTERLQFSKHGNEMHFEINALAPLQIIDQLRPALERGAPGVVVNTSAGISLGERTLDWEQLVRPATFSKLFGPYTRSKEALNVITAALAREATPARIIMRSADPGPTKTGLTKGAGTPLWMRLFAFALPSPARAAQGLLTAADPAAWNRQSGIFVSGGKIKHLPANLRDVATQNAFLERCRRRIAEN